MSPVKDVFTKCAYLFFHCTMGERDKKHFRLQDKHFFKTLDYPDKNFLRHLGERERAGGSRKKGKGEGRGTDPAHLSHWRREPGYVPEYLIVSTV